MDEENGGVEEFDVFELDPLRLDEEWLNQPKYYFKYAEKLANARNEMERAKANLEVEDAKLDRKVRANPGLFELDKITESGVEKTVTTQPAHLKAAQRLLDAKHRVNVLQAYVDTLEHRKKALENLVHLHSQNYFSEPRVSRASRETVEEGTKRLVRAKGRRDG